MLILVANCRYCIWLRPNTYPVFVVQLLFLKLLPESFTVNFTPDLAPVVFSQNELFRFLHCSFRWLQVVIRDCEFVCTTLPRCFAEVSSLFRFFSLTCKMRRLMATIKISSPHETTWLYSLGYHLKPHRTQSEKSPLSLTMDEQRILDQQSPHNELGKHHSTRNLKKTVMSPSLCDGFRTTRASTPPSALSDGNDIRGRHRLDTHKQLVWYSNGHRWIRNERLSLMLFNKMTAHSAQDHQTIVLCVVQVFWIPVTHHSAPTCLVFKDGTQDKRAIICMIW